MYKCFDNMWVDTLTTDTTIHERMLFQFSKISHFIYHLLLVRTLNMKVQRWRKTVKFSKLLRSYSRLWKTFRIPVCDRNSLHKAKVICNCAMLISNILKSIWTCGNTLTN